MGDLGIALGPRAELGRSRLSAPSRIGRSGRTARAGPDRSSIWRGGALRWGLGQRLLGLGERLREAACDIGRTALGVRDDRRTRLRGLTRVFVRIRPWHGNF